MTARPKASWRFDPGVAIAPGRHLTSCLGGGSDYEVFGAEDDVFGPVIVKLVRPNLVGTERSHRRLRREFDLLVRSQHPNIVRVVDAIFDGPHPHLVLERVDGPSLKTVLREGTMPAEAVVELGAHLAAALDRLAAHGVVHLDVKPSNVICGPHPTLIDFSVARTLDDAATLRRPVGTDIWMSPEQCTPVRRGPVGSAADVWGLGSTMWRALLGKPPFKRSKQWDRNDISQRFPQLSSVPRPLPGVVPAALATLLSRCLSVDPSERPAAIEVAAALGTPAQPVSA